MEEKPVRRSNWMGVVSIFLGMYSLVTSLWFMSCVGSFLSVYGSLNRWAESTVGMIVSAGVGLAGLVLGILGSRRAGGKDSLAKTGIFFSAAGLLLGLPASMLIYLAGGTF